MTEPEKIYGAALATLAAPLVVTVVANAYFLSEADSLVPLGTLGSFAVWAITIYIRNPPKHDAA